MLRDVLSYCFIMCLMVAFFSIIIYIMSNVGGTERSERILRRENAKKDRIIRRYEELLCEKDEIIATLRARIRQLERKEFNIDNDELK